MAEVSISKHNDDARFEMAKTVRNKYSEEIENMLSKKVRNVFFLTSGIDGADYFVFQTNNGLLLAILKIVDFGCPWEAHKWI